LSGTSSFVCDIDKCFDDIGHNYSPILDMQFYLIYIKSHLSSKF